MLAPLVGPLGFDSALELSLLVMAICGGAMTVSHVNNSYFWVVSQLTGLSLRDAYRV
jgi:gluconate:H+ symporter, GntP family